MIKFRGQAGWRAIFSKAVVPIWVNTRITREAFQSYRGCNLDLRGLERGQGIGVNLEVSQVTLMES